MCYCCLFPLSASTFLYAQKKQLILYYGCFSWREMCLQMSLLTASLSGKLSYKKLCVRTGAFIMADLLGYQQRGNAGFFAYFKLCIKLVTCFVYIIDNNQDSSGIVPREAHWHKFILFLRTYAMGFLYTFFSTVSADHCITHTEFASLKRLW